ncbi:MAG: hypothetical protein PGN26_15420 [Xylophilus ampelinus]
MTQRERAKTEPLVFKWREESTDAENGARTVFFCRRPMKGRDEADHEIAEIVGWLRKNYRRHDQYSYRIQRSDTTTMRQVLDVRHGEVVVEDRTTTFGPWMLDFEISIASDSRERFALAFQVSDDRG